MPLPKRKKTSGTDAEVIGLEGITLYREERRVLAGLALSIRRGQHWVLLGPNGSGKSSLMAVLQGLLWPIEGSVRVLGRTFGESDLSALRRIIGFVGNDIEPELPPWQTVEQIVLSGCVGTVGLRFDTPTVADRRRARALMRMAGILRLADRPFLHTSQGQRRMVVIARALMVKPGLLILDEPAAGLDPVARELFLSRLAALMRSRGGPSVLYVTHHVEEILPDFTHALLLRGGRVLAAGPVRDSLTAANLSRTFGRKVRLSEAGGRWSLRLAP
jgi:iron complex transport system ATP-binding protein